MDDEARRERRREYNRRYNERHPETRKASLQKYNSKPEVKERVRKWHAGNISNVIASRSKWYVANKEEVFQKSSEFAKAHPEWKAAHCAKRRARKLKAMPKWLNEWELFVIQEIYHLAQKRKEVTGIDWDVDHIVPLQGKAVCGLHVPWNLQVIPSSQNYSKGNRFEG